MKLNYIAVVNHLATVRREKLIELSSASLHIHELQTGEKKIRLMLLTHLVVTEEGLVTQ